MPSEQLPRLDKFDAKQIPGSEFPIDKDTERKLKEAGYQMGDTAYVLPSPEEIKRAFFSREFDIVPPEGIEFLNEGADELEKSLPPAKFTVDLFKSLGENMRDTVEKGGVIDSVLVERWLKSEDISLDENVREEIINKIVKFGEFFKKFWQSRLKYGSDKTM